jgi:hypothetical protein
VKPPTPWTGGDFVPGAFSKNDRTLISEIVEKLNKSPEKSTPGPGNYALNYKHTEGRPVSGYSAMLMKSPRISEAEQVSYEKS